MHCSTENQTFVHLVQELKFLGYLKAQLNEHEGRQELQACFRFTATVMDFPSLSHT